LLLQSFKNRRSRVRRVGVLIGRVLEMDVKQPGKPRLINGRTAVYVVKRRSDQAVDANPPPVRCPVRPSAAAAVLTICRSLWRSGKLRWFREILRIGAAAVKCL
jgi:hypothetical protein